MPRFDFGNTDTGGDQTTARPGNLSKANLAWIENGKHRTLLVMAQAVVKAGRSKSDNDICLRLEPTSDATNEKKTYCISKCHLSLRYLGDGVEITDEGSKLGTFLASKKKLEPNVGLVFDSSLAVSVANVLDLSLVPVPRCEKSPDDASVYAEARRRVTDSDWLQSQFIGEDKLGTVGFLRITRRNNLTEKEYVALFHSGWIGSGEDSLLRVRGSDALWRGPAFDIPGALAASEPARLVVREGAIWLERTGTDPVQCDNETLERGVPVALLPNVNFVVAGQTFHVEAVQ